MSLWNHKNNVFGIREIGKSFASSPEITTIRIMSIAIIGGGAAWMMCMATLIQKGYTGQVFLFEKNKQLGAKVSITGGGRCNVTTAYYKKQDIMPKYIRGNPRLLPSYKKFSSKQTYKRFEQQWCDLKIEEDMRVFPQSNQSKDVISVFERLATQIDLHLSEWVTDLVRQDDHFVVTTSQQSYIIEQVLIAVGGNAYRHTWSTGDGYTRAQKLWHTITPLWPSLNSFLTKDTWIHTLSGLSFTQAWFVIRDDTIRGSMLCTHFGISGPLTFVLAAYSAFEPITTTTPLTIKRIPDGSKKKHWPRSYPDPSITVRTTQTHQKHPCTSSPQKTLWITRWSLFWTKTCTTMWDHDQNHSQRYQQSPRTRDTIDTDREESRGRIRHSMMSRYHPSRSTHYGISHLSMTLFCMRSPQYRWCDMMIQSPSSTKHRKSSRRTYAKKTRKEQQEKRKIIFFQKCIDFEGWDIYIGNVNIFFHAKTKGMPNKNITKKKTRTKRSHKKTERQKNKVCPREAQKEYEEAQKNE